MDSPAMRKTRLRSSSSFCPSSELRLAPRPSSASSYRPNGESRVTKTSTPRESYYGTLDEEPLSPVIKLKVRPPRRLQFVYDSDDAADNQREADEQSRSRNEDDDETDTETDSRPVTPKVPRRQVTILESPVAMETPTRREPQRRNSADARSVAFQPMTSTQYPYNISSSSSSQTPSKLSAAQKRGCFQYIKRRHSIAMAFASTSLSQQHSRGDNNSTNHSVSSGDVDTADEGQSQWEFVKAKHGVEIFKSRRSRCEIRGVTRVNASVKNVMSLLAAGESTESFSHAQQILLGRDQVLEARVLASCVPSSASRYFHCGLKYMALKNPFGLNPLDLVFLDYTDVSTTPDDKLIGYRILESIRVPEFRSVTKYTRASIRCEVYIVRETEMPGVVEVTFASHLDPKSKYSASKRHTWLDQTVVRLSNLRSHAEKASFSHRLLLEKGKLVKGETRHHCFICDSSFSFLRKRHNCRLCGEVSCGRCCRKLPIFVGTETTRVRVCLGCMLQSRRQPDELGRMEVVQSRRNSIGNSTWIAYDEIEDADCDEEDEHE